MGIGQAIYDTVFGFKTPHIVYVKNFTIGLIFRLVQIVIISYVIGVAIIYKKGYQDTEVGQSAVTTKVKGIASTLHRDDLPEQYRKVWDTIDYVIPPQENGAFFVMTNAIITPAQQFGYCAEAPNIAPCNKSYTDHCIDGTVAKPTGNGVMTGKCLTNSCEIQAWCPMEAEKPPVLDKPLLPDVYNFTVLIKNSIEFPKFGVKKRNIPDTLDDEKLKHCNYDETNDPYCPVISLGYMIEKAHANFTALALQGGVIQIDILWDCNLDRDIDKCVPRFSFREMESGHTGKFGVGWNFRYANYFRDANGTLTRDLVKAYGILFVFTLTGKAGKFSIIPLLLNIGAGLALLGLATIICDIILLNCVKRRNEYKEHKFRTVEDGQQSPTPPDASPPKNRQPNNMRRQSENPSSPARRISKNGTNKIHNEGVPIGRKKTTS